jgi:hypothetical protein
MKRGDRVIRNDELANMGPGTVAMVVHGFIHEGLKPQRVYAKRVWVEHDNPGIGMWEHGAEHLKPEGE